MTGKYSLTIDGTQVGGAASFAVRDPATEEIVAEAPAASLDQLDAAVSAARRALPAWSARAPDERKAALLQMADLIEANAAELAELITREQGKPIGGLGSQWEIGGAAAWTRYTASLDLPVEIIQDDASAPCCLIKRCSRAA